MLRDVDQRGRHGMGSEERSRVKQEDFTEFSAMAVPFIIAVFSVWFFRSGYLKQK